MKRRCARLFSCIAAPFPGGRVIVGEGFEDEGFEDEDEEEEGEEEEFYRDG